MKVYLISINGVSLDQIALLTPERAAKARRYRFADDKKRCIAAGLLLRRFLGNTEITADEFGKPRAANGVCFNLSHSGGWVALAVAGSEVGCDIESIKMTDPLRLGKVVYTPAELDELRLSRDRLGKFYEFWTKKEALLKCMGRGFHRAAKSVDVRGNYFCEDGHIYQMKTAAFADCTLSVCVRDGRADFETERVVL